MWQLAQRKKKQKVETVKMNTIVQIEKTTTNLLQTRHGNGTRGVTTCSDRI